MAETLSDGFDRRLPLLADFGPKVESLLTTLIRGGGLEAVAVTHRVKAKASALKKAAGSTPPMGTVAEVHDLLGLRVITYFADDVDKVAALIEQEFEVDPSRTKDKRASLDPDRFGYVSVHYGARLNDARRKLVEWNPYVDVFFEVQIRSALQHAWAEIEHDLGYKSTAGSVPAEFRRRFSRLAGMLELADEEFQKLRDDLLAYEKSVEAAHERVEDEDVNQVTLAWLIENNDTVRRADEAIAAGHGAELTSTDTLYARLRAEEMLSHSLKSIGMVERLLADEAEVVVRLAIAWLNDVGPVEPDDIEDDPERELKGPDGHYLALQRGISLFYLSRHLDAASDDAERDVEPRFAEFRRRIVDEVPTDTTHVEAAKG